MTDDLAQRAARHRPTTDYDERQFCVSCEDPWPCTTHELAAALTAEQAQLIEVQARIMALELVAQAARDFAIVVGPRGGYLTAYTALEDALAVLAALDADV